jgi:general secretion pathway protein K
MSYVSRFTNGSRLHARCSPFPTERGIALVIVMIAIFTLTMLAAVFAISMKTETRLALNANSETEIEWLGRSGVEYACWVLACSLDPTHPYDSLDQPWATGTGELGPTNAPFAEVQNPIHMGRGTITWHIFDLERKVNINTADERTLQQTLNLMGVDAGDMAPIIGSILNWTAAGGNIHHLQGADSSDYQSMNPPYELKAGPIDDISELLFIRGITPELYWGAASSNSSPAAFQAAAKHQFGSQSPQTISSGLKDLFTPVSAGKININTASADVLQLIPGVDQQVAEAIVAGRSGVDDGSGLTGPYRNVGQISRLPEIGQMGGFISGAIQQMGATQSRTFEVHVTAEVAGYSRHFVALVGRNNQHDVQILNFYWED